MAKFETRIVLVNQYGEEVCELEKTGVDGCYKLPKEILWDIFCDGDVLTVKEIETEVE